MQAGMGEQWRGEPKEASSGTGQPGSVPQHELSSCFSLCGKQARVPVIDASVQHNQCSTASRTAVNLVYKMQVCAAWDLQLPKCGNKVNTF